MPTLLLESHTLVFSHWLAITKKKYRQSALKMATIFLLDSASLCCITTFSIRCDQTSTAFSKWTFHYFGRPFPITRFEQQTISLQPNTIPISTMALSQHFISLREPYWVWKIRERDRLLKLLDLTLVRNRKRNWLSKWHMKKSTNIVLLWNRIEYLNLHHEPNNKPVYFGCRQKRNAKWHQFVIRSWSSSD